MDEFYEYWELIPENEKYEAIGQEIVRYKRNLQDPEISSRDLSENVIRFFQEKLLNNPYPTYFLIYHIIDIKDHEKNQLLEEIIFNTIIKLVDLIIEHPQELDKQFKLFNLLSNVFISDHGMQKIQDIIVPALYDLKENRRLLDNASTYFALLSRNSLGMLRQYLDYERSRLLEKFDERTIFLKCHYEKRHWIDSILRGENDDLLRQSWSQSLHNSIQASRLILKMGQHDEGQLWSECQSIDPTVIDNDILELCFLEVSRQCELSNFLKAHSSNFAVIDTTKSHIMTQLLKQQVAFSMEKYESIFNILTRNHELNLTQRNKYLRNSNSAERTEMQLFNEYMIVKIYLIDILQERSGAVDESLKHVRTLLKTINDGNVLHRLLQIIISLVFLRFDHVRKARLRRKGNEFNSTDSTPTQNNSTDVSDSVFIDSFNNSGFMCTRKSLETVLNSIRVFLASLDINEAYKNSNHELKERFAELLQYVDKGLWKLAIIEKSFERVESQKFTFKISREWLFIHDDARAIVAPEKTSDEEKHLSRRKNVRRKARKRSSKHSHKSDDRDEDSENENLQNSAITETSENRVKIGECKKPDDIINKMLMTAESMIALCVQRRDFETAERIIREYNLVESNVADEIRFIKHFDETIHELNLIAQKYQEISIRRSQLSENVYDVKMSAEAGFELAKLTDVLDKFSTSIELKHLEGNEYLIEKVISQHPHLWSYQRPFPIITTMIDFMISVSNQCDLNLAVSNFIFKKWNFTGEDRKHYYVGLLKNIIKILSTLNDSENPFSISSFFNNEIFCLEPTKFKSQMENRRKLMELLTVELQNLNDESMLEDISMKLENFQSDINYFKRTVNYVRNTRLITKFQTNESQDINRVLSELSVSDMIGKIIFVQQYNPDLLTNFCFNANINLLHEIVIAGAGEILPPILSMAEDEKLLSLFHLHQIGSQSGLEESCESQNIYDISNADILYYIKKSGSFLVAYLLKEIQDFDYKTLRYDEPNFFERIKGLVSIKKSRDLYNGNTVMAALNYDHNDLKRLFKRINTLELREKLAMLDCVTEKSWRKDKRQFDELRDTYIEMLISTKSQGTLELLKQVGNIKKFNELLLKHIREISSDSDAERLLGWSLCTENLREVNQEQKDELEKWLQRLKIYQEILKLYNSREDGQSSMTWLNILQLAESNTSVLIHFLMNVCPDFSLCHQLLRLHPVTVKSEEIYGILIEALNKKELNSQHPMLFKIIRTFPPQIVVDFFNHSLNLINNLDSMKFILNDLISRNLPVKTCIKYQKFQISCIIIEHLGHENKQLWLLAPYPLIIIEQALMNSKIEALNSLVKELRVFFKNQPSCNLCHTTSKSNQIGETLVYDYDAHHTNMWVSNECIDFLFKIYAAKALDFQIIDIYSQQSNTSGAPSVDSIQSRVYHMPKEPPTRELWVKDNEAISCMCCRKSKFSLLNRRHHCRRCGRVVCADCTRNRIVLPELYGELMVRCCDDCTLQLEDERRKVEVGSIEKARSADVPLEWRLTSDLSVDQMIRDEFTFEYSPNVSLCIAIICLHTINDEFTSFLLFHCHRLELLLRPINGRINPEIDIILVAKMLKNLATTAKLFGDMGESNLIIDHADMILKIAENDCESILSKASFSNLIFSISIRDVVNELIKSENWKLAIELSVKWDRNTKSGIFSAWAVSLMKGGQYKLAREKIALALQPVAGCSSKSNEQLLAAIASSGPIYPLGFTYKRPSRSSPLLYEIMEVIESCVPKHSIMAMSTPSISVSQKLNSSSPKMANSSVLESSLKRIMEGDYGSMTRRLGEKFDWNQMELLKSHYYEESMHYLISYGGNSDISDFLMRNNLVRFALRYTLLQKVPLNLFIQSVFVPIIKSGKLGDFIEIVKQVDENFGKCKPFILAVCKYLERKKSLHVLYQLQLLVEDYIRASQTSLKFYLDGAGNYHELNEKSRHLMEAKNHLQTELERVERGMIDGEIQLRWDIKSINAQINIISLQFEVSKYLASCELSGLPTLDVMPKIFMDKISLKTLLGKQNERSQVAILLLICGQTIESGFGLSYRIMQECSLPPAKIYTTCTKYLARDLTRLIEVEKLIGCIKANASSAENVVDPDTEKLCDELIAMAVEIAYTQHQAEAKVQIDQLIRLISSRTMKIQCYINSNQLKTAFVNCAALPNNFDYIKRIMRQAEITRQENIRRLCEKKLQQSMCSSWSESIGSSSDKF